MSEKLYPIGTVCTLYGSSESFMIIGYLAIEYDKGFKKYDYHGCLYPDGITGKKKIFGFNHNDIKKVIYSGYEDEDKLAKLTFNSMNNIENSKTKVSSNFENVDLKVGFDLVTEPKEPLKRPVISNGFIFDEDGYIVKEELSALENPFHKEYEKVDTANVESDSKNWDIFKNIKFDENGFVIDDGQEINENSEMNLNEEVLETQNSDLGSKIKFDENGFVVADGNEEALETENSDLGSKIKFDENGFVVADGNEEALETENSDLGSKIKFDENGFVVADGNEEALETENSDLGSKIKFDENGFVVADGNEEALKTENSDLGSNIKFDENGFVVADGNEEALKTENSDLGSNIKFDENGFVVADGNEIDSNDNSEIGEEVPKDNPALANVKFDENGFVVSVE